MAHALQTPEPQTAPVPDADTVTDAGPSRRVRASVAVAAPLGRALEQTGEMVALLGTVIRSAVLQPRGYWGDVRDQIYSLLKLCWFPLAVSTIVFGLGAPGLQGGNLFFLFGIPERLGSFFVMASIREFAPWVTAMIVAGVVGTSITADLGARRIREEIDAMEVLGVDPVRTLVVPRVLALTIATAGINLFALLLGVVGGWIAAVPVFGATSGAFFSSFFDMGTVVDLWGTVVKTTLFGLIIGVVCCYKGFHAQGGPAGVGRAVNQAVVIAFAAIWVVNYVFTTVLLGLNPEMKVFK